MNIVLLSTADWDNPFWTNKQHVAVEFAKTGHSVFYIDSLGLRKPSASTRDLKRIVRRIIKAVQPPRKVRENLWIWSPIVLPWHNNIYIRKINRFLLESGLWFWLKVLGLKRDLLWTYNPLTAEFFDLSSFNSRVYHCVDEIKAQPGMPVEVLESAEEKLARGVDIIFTTSPQLTQTRSIWNSNTHYLPNVADYDHFNTALAPHTIIPTDLEAIPKPHIGFIGAISGYKVDFKLLKKLAVSHPEWSITLIGDVGEGDPWTDSSLLEGLPNLYFMGPKPYQELPAYLKGFDVALLPNTINEYTDSMFPMKFFEYLAAGRAVVSVKLKAIAEFSNVALLSDNHAQFIYNIEQALLGNVPKLEDRLAIAREYTYEARTKRMLKLLQEVRHDESN